MIAPALAFEEEGRAEGMAALTSRIASTPDHPAAGSLWLYQHCLRVAFESAAALAVQPEGWPWPTT
ncbi:hypothetical protein K388_05542 [Streptomyces sp. KhCrAH-43]|nr:hypothetical protein K388_05542 [Streptomyces sp. KhCrAH-43]